MTYLQSLYPAKSSILTKLFGPLVVAASFLAAYFPTVRSLIDGPLQPEQEGHGPLIIAASLWLVWQSREKLKTTVLNPAPVIGWSTLIFGLLQMFLARTQGVLAVEVFSALPVIAGCVLLSAGWPMLPLLAFPIGFFFFAIPAPHWMIDSVTGPLKVFISVIVTHV